MHIEPGIVTGAKIVLSYATAAGAVAYSGKLIWENLVARGALSLIGRGAIATLATIIFFELLPHMAVGVSEVHLIMGSTLLLMLGTAPAAIGLALGLLLQGLLFSPFDLPQYGMNLTTLLVPLLGLHAVTKTLIAKGTAYVDLTYKQALAMSVTYQGGIVAWVAFWAFYGQGFGAENTASVLSFGAAYMTVILLEPLVDLGVLAGAKALRGLEKSGLVSDRLYAA
ncbi:hypothetical protein FHS72_000649 [Loktanella ponticola]|uniref:Cobalt transporter n=1 Tax=Yoonia ponticola TaxID=1524255 RepID=A0A7W9EWT9_9RHOB|nr:energy-coupling factor ABC transporter permease [Yoonia ponticola]MBB5721042.1 hypothetical protein [Yoonia ponticola]